VVPKSEDTKAKILNRLKQSFLFSSLSEHELQIVVGAMEEKRYTPGQNVINQGEDGFELFVVESGVLSCTKLFSGKT
jgi:cAMP-dependent protein kinase regulator